MRGGGGRGGGGIYTMCKRERGERRDVCQLPAWFKYTSSVIRLCLCCTIMHGLEVGIGGGRVPILLIGGRITLSRSV